MQFVHESVAQRVVFATGSAYSAVAQELEAANFTRVMLIASKRRSGLVDRMASELPVVLRHHEIVMHVPEDVASRARYAAADVGADVLVSVGGGSATGLAKAIALTTGLPIIAVPTTYAGSEATDVWGTTVNGVKTTGVDRRTLPRSVVYDAALLSGLDRQTAIASGLNAVAHCVDSMWGPRADPIDRVLAAEALESLAQGIAHVARDPTGLTGIEQSLYGAYLAATAFSSAGSGMHHKICHVLGGMFDLPHAQTHAVVLPHVLSFNAPNAPHAEELIARALGAHSAVEGMESLVGELDAPRALRELGMPQDGISAALTPILDVIPANNPTPVDRDNLAELLFSAWSGQPMTVPDH
ncbi:Maleylacetate reductase (plasmid) [Rhodococcus erythropolis R138]|uniref:maleylacetate reductase n=1 Tax=Rhodococcus erythropolis TaxID=1833 RepID=UPI000492AAF2|nr:maleylacetate reductase [Rhodococcus erythropolis]ALU73450.1 Maleylacetate reductase [Rhodococcus erythropolis R138]